MVRGTFANVRLRNQLRARHRGRLHDAHCLDGEQMSIYDAAMKYQQEIPLVVLAGKEYGSGSSRDWAAKGPKLLGVRAVIAESYERIHRSNLPLGLEGEDQTLWGLTGFETYDITGLAEGTANSFASGREVNVRCPTPRRT